MRHFAFLLLALLTTSCGITEFDRISPPRPNLEMEVTSARVLWFLSGSTREIGVDVRVMNTTNNVVYVATERFVLSPDSHVVGPVTAARPYASNESSCPSLPVPPGSAHSCSLVFAWREPQPVEQVVPASVFFAEEGTGTGGSARIEAFD